MVNYYPRKTIVLNDEDNKLIAALREAQDEFDELTEKLEFATKRRNDKLLECSDARIIARDLAAITNRSVTSVNTIVGKLRSEREMS
jgi:hypothetical protein